MRKSNLAVSVLGALLTSVIGSCALASPPADWSPDLRERPATLSEECLWLHRTSLRELVSRVNRHSTRKLAIVDPAIRDFRLSGRVCVTHLDSLLRALDRMGISVIEPEEPSGGSQAIRLARSRQVNRVD